MATASLTKLRKQAGAAGMDGYRGASRDELEEFLANGAKPKAAAKKKSTGPVKKQAGRTQSRGSSKSSPAKSTKGAQAKRTASPTKAKTAPKASSNGAVGRAAIGKVKFTGFDPDDWKPRDGSATSMIFKSLKKHKGNRTAVFSELVKNIGDYVPLKKQDGTKRTKAEREARLLYVINRTLWEFVTRTGQHAKASNRIEYGTGENASQRVRGKTILKPAKSTSAKKAPAKRGRPKGSTNKPKTTTRKKTASRK